MASHNDHYGNLQKLCRICGGKRSKGRPYHSQVFAVEIKSIFKIDLTNDKTEVHPRYLCFGCHSRLSSTDDTVAPDIAAVTWKEHDDGDECWVCSDIKATTSTAKPDSFVIPVKPAPKRRRADSAKNSTVTKSKDVCVKIKDLNEQLLCTICSGYLVEATSIMECLHTFCKSCIVKHLQTRTTCPNCKIIVHESAPLQNIRLDTKFQDIVNKLVPNLYDDETKRKKEFYANRGLSVPERGASSRPITPIGGADKTEQETFPPNDGRTYFHTDDIRLSLCIEPVQSADSGVSAMPSKYIRCSMRLKAEHLLKFIQQKTCLKEELELLCNKQTVDGSATLENIWLDTWKVKEAPMRLFYKKRPV